MRVLVAPDGFTGSLPALQVATAIGRGWRRPVSPPGSCRWPTAVTAAWRPPCTPAPLPARYPCAGPTDAGTTPSSRSMARPRSSRSPAPADRARCRRASWPRWRRPATASVRRCSRPSMRALDASSAASAAAPAPTAAQARSPHSASSSSWPPRHRPDPDLSRLLAAVAGGLVGRRSAPCPHHVVGGPRQAVRHTPRGPQLRIAQDAAADELLSRDPLALLLGMLLDQHMRRRSS
jgi:hypothetical protein